ncbi:MAG: phosphoribosyltransferase [Flavobacteriaceae bacterium]|nr:phosphoribosyltransferase [Flavobacteriaceae bacterium]
MLNKVADSKSKIMDAYDIQKTVKRIAFQIYENHYEEKQLVLAGIADNGLILGKRILKELKKISDLEVVFMEVKIQKENPREKITLSSDLAACKNKSVVVIDDVLNTGSTLIYAVSHFLGTEVKKLQTAVLVNRNHKNYPVKGDFKGISLSTSIKERIEVVFGADEGVYLS